MPLSLLGTLLFMPILDISFNLISMLGIIITLGMLLDNSIVISENIYSYRMKGMDPEGSNNPRNFRISSSNCRLLSNNSCRVYSDAFHEWHHGKICSSNSAYGNYYSR
ncbi:MAG: efflux RND transporter permease subunit [Leptospiraceae bacterium]|nr:efflux RND transporter permease subunit [Leptospiraceae bacterium]